MNSNTHVWKKDSNQLQKKGQKYQLSKHHSYKDKLPGVTSEYLSCPVFQCSKKIRITGGFGGFFVLRY